MSLTLTIVDLITLSQLLEGMQLSAVDYDQSDDLMRGWIEMFNPVIVLNTWYHVSLTARDSKLTASSSEIPSFEIDELACLNPQLEELHIFTLSSVQNAQSRTKRYNKRG